MTGIWICIITYCHCYNPIYLKEFITAFFKLLFWYKQQLKKRYIYIYIIRSLICFNVWQWMTIKHWRFGVTLFYYNYMPESCMDVNNILCHKYNSFATDHSKTRFCYSIIFGAPQKTVLPLFLCMVLCDVF